ncbi:ankyrin repeat domain-containing protein [Achromobacter deleyi]|uniref:Ankyrin repeat domain-containing protein n=1 Tax=Achromobacter deleyi TaxID=1353891 RepID=A0A7T4B7Q7_9BURK|nr:ankyrin repeat domain-containing protein [Achromobacter deleyi]QQB37261.1 ankyrin repeat domain-containing protein [Achromobacter deleyi]
MSIIRSWRAFLAATLLMVAEGGATGVGATGVGAASPNTTEAGAALLRAAGDGDAARVQALLAEGAPREARDADGNTPLLRATLANAEAAATALIEAGADVNAKNAMQDSAYLYAGARGHNGILARTLRHGADLRSTNRYGGTALIPACERGLIETVRMLLAAGVDPNHVNRLGWTGLLEAIILSDGGPDHQAVVALLIAGGADVNLADGDGRSPLWHARQRGQAATTQLLLAAGAR